MLQFKNEDQMKVAIANELLQQYGIEHIQIDKNENTCCIALDGNQYWIIDSKIRCCRGNTSNVTLVHELSDFESNGSTADTIIKIIKTWLKTHNMEVK